MLKPLKKPAVAASLSLAQLIDEANRLVGGGKVADAVALYQSWIRRDTTPMRKVAWFNLAVLHASAGRLAEARRGYEAALDIDPGFHQARMNLGLTLERMGLPD